MSKTTKIAVKGWKYLLVGREQWLQSYGELVFFITNVGKII